MKNNRSTAFDPFWLTAGLSLVIIGVLAGRYQFLLSEARGQRDDLRTANENLRDYVRALEPPFSPTAEDPVEVGSWYGTGVEWEPTEDGFPELEGPAHNVAYDDDIIDHYIQWDRAKDNTWHYRWIPHEEARPPTFEPVADGVFKINLGTGEPE